MKPRLWAGLAPFGIGRTKPHHYLEMARAAWDNRHAPLYAWRILSRGVCDGCALGVAGFRDWTIEGIHKRTPSAGNSPSHSCVGTDDRLVITTAVRTPTPDPVYVEGEA